MQKQFQHMCYGGAEMSKFKKILRSIFLLLVEYVTLFFTIISSAYIVITSQYIEYSRDDLLLWIISLLGLIATAIAAERYFTLGSIEKRIEAIQTKIEGGGPSLDQLLFRRRDLSPLEDRLKDATSIIITGGSLARLSDEYYGFFEQKLKDGCKLEVILVRPNSEAANQLCLNTVYETSDIQIYNRKITESLSRFAELKQNFPQNVFIWLSELTPPYSIIGKNIEKEDAFIQVELYSYAVPTRERVEFTVSANDVNTMSFFKNQIDILKRASEEYKDVIN